MYDSGDPPCGQPVSTLLLLHGWTSTAALNWYKCLPHLREHYRVVALDHRGHGRGLRARKPFRLEDCADDAAALMAQMGIHSVIPVGYSMGGPVAQLLWRRHSGLVGGLVLCATAARFKPRRESRGPLASVAFGASMALWLVPSVIRDRGMAVATRNWSSRNAASGWASEEWSRHDPSSLIQAGLALGRFDSRSWLAGVDARTAVVVTCLDRTVPPASQWEMVAAMNEAVAFPVGTDHRGCVDNVTEFVPALLAACRYADGKPLPGDSALEGERPIVSLESVTPGRAI
jgi:3-oxoadipate enol-lactonase